MRINFGHIPYLNTSVFYQDFPLDLVDVREYVPSALSRAARRGEIDVGPVPIVTCFELEDQFVPLRDFAIAVKNQARSVLLFSKKPIEELHGSSVGITGESSTSVQLLKILFSRRFEIEPAEYVSTKQLDSDAILLIGDAALNNRHGLPSYKKVYDLAGMWNEWTGLPFVFARWIVRRDLNSEAIEFLGDLMQKSLARGIGRINEICKERSDLNMTTDEVREYLEGFNYVMGPQEKKAIEVFRKYVDEQQAAISADAGTADTHSPGAVKEKVKEVPGA